MPANLTPEYQRAEEQYRQATDDAARLEALQEMLRAIPKHKGTEKMQADLKRRISQLRKSQAKKGGRKGPDPFQISKAGAGQIILVGAPNVGKSMLVAVTTNAPVKVADYPYTTTLPVPGMCSYEDVQIELIDTPPVTAEHVPPGLMHAVRMADVVCVVADAAGDALEQAEMTLDVLSRRGVELRSAPRGELDPERPDLRSGIVVATKADLAGPGAVEALRDLFAGRLEVWSVSPATKQGLAEWIQRLWQLLAVMRVYAKEPGKDADREKPFTLPVGSTIADLARQIHRDLPETMKYARIWGKRHFDGQQVYRTEPLEDGDVVEIRE